MTDAFLSPAAVSRIEALNRKGFRTRWLLAGSRSLRLARWDTAQQKHVAMAAQDILAEVAPRAETVVASASGEAVTLSGYLTAEVPFDVREDDLFAMDQPGGEVLGRVVSVELPHLGLQRAGWVVRQGGVPG